MEMDEEKIENFKKILAFLAAVSGWILSIIFSNQGFNIQVHNMVWAGWTLSFIITTIELVFNSQLKYQSSNYSIFILGVLSYLYDVGTNIVGLMAAGGMAAGSVSIQNNNIIAFFIYLFMACLLAVAPEMLLVYALIGISGSGEGDLIRNLFEMAGRRSGGGGNRGGNGNRGGKQNNQNHNKQKGGGNGGGNNRPQTFETGEEFDPDMVMSHAEKAKMRYQQEGKNRN